VYDDLFRLLTEFQSGDLAFNQYRDVHPDLDLPDGARIRRQNLGCYLECFSQNTGVRFVLVGEAAGYAGCRFSGIPFTSEAQLEDPDRLSWAVDYRLARSSSAEQPWAERSAKMVWETLGKRKDSVLWNAFPWHPIEPSRPLTNRSPGRDLHYGYGVLECFLALYPNAQPYAIGRVAQRALLAIGVEAPYIRHPSRGGKAKFVTGLSNLSCTGSSPAQTPENSP
jgi:hypothetical protein